MNEQRVWTRDGHSYLATVYVGVYINRVCIDGIWYSAHYVFHQWYLGGPLILANGFNSKREMEASLKGVAL